MVGVAEELQGGDLTFIDDNEAQQALCTRIYSLPRPTRTGPVAQHQSTRRATTNNATKQPKRSPTRTGTSSLLPAPDQAATAPQDVAVAGDSATCTDLPTQTAADTQRDDAARCKELCNEIAKLQTPESCMQLLNVAAEQ
eukprot:jgi/Chlat1/2757/Chrsp187S02902